MIVLLYLGWLLATAESRPIERAGASFPGAAVHRSPWNPQLAIAAQQHADRMAREQRQGHQDWDRRFQELRQAGFAHPVEICAESWPWQAEESEEDLWKDAFRSWRHSAGHWRTAGQVQRAYGAGLAQGRNRIWYFCIIADAMK